MSQSLIDTYKLVMKLHTYNWGTRQIAANYLSAWLWFSWAPTLLIPWSHANTPPLCCTVLWVSQGEGTVCGKVQVSRGEGTVCGKKKVMWHSWISWVQSLKVTTGHDCCDHASQSFTQNTHAQWCSWMIRIIHEHSWAFTSIHEHSRCFTSIQLI